MFTMYLHFKIYNRKVTPPPPRLSVLSIRILWGCARYISFAAHLILGANTTNLSWQPRGGCSLKGIRAQRAGVFSVSIGSHGIEPNPTTYTIQTLLLRDSDDSVFLPDQLRPASPIDVIPPVEGQLITLFSIVLQHFVLQFISSKFILPSAHAFTLPLLSIAFSHTPHYLPLLRIAQFASSQQKKSGYFHEGPSKTGIRAITISLKYFVSKEHFPCLSRLATICDRERWRSSQSYSATTSQTLAQPGYPYKLSLPKGNHTHKFVLCKVNVGADPVVGGTENA
ncbi:hypothetical protein BKA64DRAFT_256100 [Cadophora sp. MPI-SDFR-AT-0126]|nr:hypothetical protein BKA64DRAFT_256100 [Leotiomycetes sp. MPI-SDFR-AT-0126]